MIFGVPLHANGAPRDASSPKWTMFIGEVGRAPTSRPTRGGVHLHDVLRSAASWGIVAKCCREPHEARRTLRHSVDFRGWVLRRMFGVLQDRRADRLPVTMWRGTVVPVTNSKPAVVVVYEARVAIPALRVNSGDVIMVREDHPDRPLMVHITLPISRFPALADAILDGSVTLVGGDDGVIVLPHGRSRPARHRRGAQMLRSLVRIPAVHPEGAPRLDASQPPAQSQGADPVARTV